MSDFIVFTSQEVEPKGLSKDQTIDIQKLRTYFFADEFDRLALLNSLTVSFTKKEAILLYPGSGTDIFTPLHYIEKLFSSTQNWTFLFVDTSSVQQIIETQLHEVGISFSREKNTIKFYWKEILVEVTFFEQDIFTSMHEFTNYDIYFEKAFRIMKDQSPFYETEIVNNLATGGIIISDSGFRAQKLEFIGAPQELSTYHEMIIGIKSL